MNISKDAVEAIAAEFDKRVEMHAQLASGPCGEIRTARGDETAKTHSTTAAMLRALSSRVAELEYIRSAKDEEIETLRKSRETSEGIRATAYRRGRLQGLDEAEAQFPIDGAYQRREILERLNSLKEQQS